MNNLKSEDKVRLLANADVVGLAKNSLDSIGNTAFAGAFCKCLNHLWLNINGNDFAGIADHPRHCYREEAQACADINDSHPLFD